MFGDNVEDLLGKWKYVILLVAATMVGNMAHMIGDPRSMMPCVGASGGISGVITFYALKFPKIRLGLAYWFVFRLVWLRMSACWMFVIWVALQFFGAWQQMGGFTNVSAFAHLGGALTGLIFWMVYRNK